MQHFAAYLDKICDPRWLSSSLSFYIYETDLQTEREIIEDIDSN